MNHYQSEIFVLLQFLAAKSFLVRVFNFSYILFMVIIKMNLVQVVIEFYYLLRVIKMYINEIDKNLSRMNIK